MTLLSPCIMGWSELVALSACIVLAVTRFSGQPFVPTDIRPDATQNTGTVTAWAPFQALFPRNYMKLPANTKPVFFSSLREYPEHQQKLEKCKWMGQSCFTCSQGMAMGSTASCSSLMLELHGEDTTWWEQILQQNQDWQLLKPENTAGDYPGVLCLQWGR